MADDWHHLGTAVRRRRDDLGITQSQVQARGGPSSALLRTIETGRASSLSQSKRRDLERALEWRLGSVDDLLAGGDAAPDTEPIEIPHIVQHPEIGEKGAYELTRKLTVPGALELYGLALLAGTLAAAADDYTQGEGDIDRVISLAHKTNHAAVQIFADAMSLDIDEAREAIRRFGYLFGEGFEVGDNPRT